MSTVPDPGRDHTVQVPAGQLDPLPHAGQAEVVEAALLLGGRVEPDPVVVDLQHHRLGRLGQLDPGP